MESEKFNEEHTHSSIIKSISVFGFMQFFKLLIGIITTKFAAVFLGPSGIGIIGLIKNALSLIGGFTGFGFSQVSVKEIATHLNDPDKKKINNAIYLVKQTSLFIGFLGCLTTIILSVVLSKWIFNDYSNFYWFVLLSITFVFNSYSTACLAIFKGMNLLKSIAISSIISSVLSSLLVVFFYYNFKIDGIIPALISSSVIVFAVNLYFVNKLKINHKRQSISENFKEAIPMFKLGSVLSINIIFGLLCNFIIRLYIDKYGFRKEDLGFYEVSIVILASYIGMVFSAMSSDFFPRLTSVQHKNSEVKELVNKQIDIAFLIITPMIVFFYLTSNLIIKLLYTDSFLPVESILKFGLLAILLKAMVWPMDFIVLSKGNKKQYFKQQLLGDSLNIILTILLYNFLGLVGIGISAVLNYILSGSYLLNYVRKNYQFNFNEQCLKTILVSFLFGIGGCLSYCLLPFYFKKIILMILFIASGSYSIYQLNNRTQVLLKLREKFNKK